MITTTFPLHAVIKAHLVFDFLDKPLFLEANANYNEMSNNNSQQTQRKIPNEDTPMNKELCQSLYWNLLHCSAKSNIATLPSHFIRELEQTKRCDTVAYDFSALRNRYKSYIDQFAGPDSFEQIVFAVNKHDKLEYAAAQAVLHYATFTEESLVGALSFTKKLHYYTIYQVENILANFHTPAFVGLQKLVKNYKQPNTKY